MNDLILHTRRLQGVKKANNDNKNVVLFASSPPHHVPTPDITIDTDILTSPKTNKLLRKPKNSTKSLFQRSPTINNTTKESSNRSSITNADEVSTNLLLRFNNVNNKDDNSSTQQPLERVANTHKISMKKKHIEKDSTLKTSIPPQPKPQFRLFISTKKRVRYTHILSDKAGTFPTEDTINGPIVYNSNNNRHNREVTKMKPVKQNKQTPLWLLPMYELSSHSTRTTATTTMT